MWSRSWRRNLAELLECPARRRMSGDVDVGDPARAHLHDKEDVQHPKAGRYRDEEVARQNAFRVVAHRRHPTLRGGASFGSWVIGHIASDGPR
jgi:hypothetical protein